MDLTLRIPAPEELPSVVAALASFQQEGVSVQLHPGDVGWNQMFGADRVAAALRVWEYDGEPLAIGLLDDDTSDDPAVLRLGVSSVVADDEQVATEFADQLTHTDVLGQGPAVVEVRYGAALRHALQEHGWSDDAPWASFRLDLTAPLPGSGLRIETVDESRIADRVAVQRAAFARSTFSEARWRAMAAGPAYAHARCLVAYDGETPVATTTAWSAGPGRPGLIEPLGVHRDHRGRGHGRAITQAAAAALHELGASSMVVATRASNTAAVAAYATVMERLPDVPDLVRG